jgi:uncharacterized protein YbjT (DUF2867 family)
MSKIAVAGATGRVGRHVVDVLRERGHDVVPIARSHGVDVITGEGLADALAGVETVVDAASFPAPDQAAATEFFGTATENLQREGERAGVERLVVVSIIGADRVDSGYIASKIPHERAALAGPIPARILRAAQFHEFVPQFVEWCRQGDVAYVPEMRTQLVAARAVAEALADLTGAGDGPILEIAGPREESLVAVAELLSARRGDPPRVEGVHDPADPEQAAYTSGALLPGPDAILAGPPFEEWLAA